MTAVPPRPPAWLGRLGRFVIRMSVDARRREEIEGDLSELWEHRSAAGRRDLRRGYLKDLLGVVAARRPGSRRTTRGLGNQSALRGERGEAAGRSRGGFGMGQDFRYALRLMRRRPAATVAMVLTLGIGIGAGTAIFTAVDRLLVRPLPFPEPHQLVHVVHPPLRFARTGGMVSQSFIDLPAIAAAGVWASGGANLDAGGEGIRVTAAAVDDGFFAAMAVPALVGQTLPKSDRVTRYAVLSHELWVRRFNADRAIVGQSISINGRSYPVTGVMPPGFVFPGRTEVWVPPLSDLQLTGAAFAPQVIARVAPGFSLDQARAAVTAYDAAGRTARGASVPASPEDGMGLRPLADELTRQSRPTLVLLAATVTLLLLVVCASVANLILARVAVREREFAVRLALGASRWRVVRQLLVECLLLSGAGALTGAIGAAWALNSLRVLAPDVMGPFAVGAIDLRSLTMALGVALVTTVLFGAAPGLAAASRQAGQVVRTGRDEHRSPAWRRLRSGLVVSQMALALMLLTASAAAVAALVRATRVDVGFGSPRALGMTVTLPIARFQEPPAIRDFFERAHARLTAVPGVRRVGATGFLPGSKDIGAGFEFRVAGNPEPPDDKKIFLSYLSASPDYFTVMGIRVIAGRPFAGTDATGAPPVVILSETAAKRLFPDGTPAVGQRVQTARPNGAGVVFDVAGVVADVHLWAAEATPRDLSQAYVSLLQSPPFGNLSFVAEMDGPPESGIAAIRAAMHDVDAAVPIYDAHAIDSVVDRYLASHRLSGTLVSGFAIVTLLVASIGLYGLMAQRVTDRMREIGIRMALGANPRDVGRQVVRDGIVLTTAGALLGSAAGFAALRLFGAIVPIQEDVSPWVVAANAAILIATGLAASWHPASRAIRVDPVTVLRDG
ncbi:MAG TPA: ADOP family duplicated permease [Vicinamibacterales bacterium]